MSCIIRECPNPECGYADGKHPSERGAVAWCPKCGAILEVLWDEVRDHDDYDEPTEYEMDEPA